MSGYRGGLVVWCNINTAYSGSIERQSLATARFELFLEAAFLDDKKFSTNMTLCRLIIRKNKQSGKDLHERKVTLKDFQLIFWQLLFDFERA